MSDISKIKIRDTVYGFKDAVARGEAEETEGISCFELNGTVYNYKDAVARGEGSAEANEISTVSVGGKVYQIKDEEARNHMKYFFILWQDNTGSFGDGKYDDWLGLHGDYTYPKEDQWIDGHYLCCVFKAEDVMEGRYPDIDDGIDRVEYIRDNVQAIIVDSSAAGFAPTSLAPLAFNEFAKLELIDLDNMNTSALTDMSNLFLGCTSLTSFSAKSIDVSNVTDMSYMFASCIKLASVTIDDWDVSNVTSMECMFNACRALSKLDVSKWNPSSVTNVQGMFFECYAIDSFDFSNWDTSNVTDMRYMLNGCTGLTTIYSDDAKFVTTKVTNGYQMFARCDNLVGGNGTAYADDNDKDDESMAHIDTASNPGYFTEAKK